MKTCLFHIHIQSLIISFSLFDLHGPSVVYSKLLYYVVPLKLSHKSLHSYQGAILLKAQGRGICVLYSLIFSSPEPGSLRELIG